MRDCYQLSFRKDGSFKCNKGNVLFSKQFRVLSVGSIKETSWGEEGQKVCHVRLKCFHLLVFVIISADGLVYG